MARRVNVVIESSKARNKWNIRFISVARGCHALKIPAASLSLQLYVYAIPFWQWRTQLTCNACLVIYHNGRANLPKWNTKFREVPNPAWNANYVKCFHLKLEKRRQECTCFASSVGLSFYRRENETERLKFTALYSFYIDGKFILYVEFENDRINKWIIFPIFTGGQWSGRETGRWSISKQSPLMFVLDSLGVNCNGCARRCLLELNTPPLINKAQLPLMSNRKHRNFYAPFPHLSLLSFLIPHISM